MTTGLLDNSVVVDWHDPAVGAQLPHELVISAITVAELAAGPHVASNPDEAAKRQARLQAVESRFEPLPFDGMAARSYDIMAAGVVAAGRRPRGRRADLLIAATAHAHGLDLYTRNGDDFRALEHLVRVVHI